MTQPGRTPLYDEHIAAGGRMVEFAGYELPVQYSSLTEEHTAVRTRAGLFDVSHMGELFITGPGAFDFLQMISCNDHSAMTVGRAQYTGIMYPEGTFVDDVLVHKMADDEYLLVVNAANRAKDAAYLIELAADRDDVEVRDESDKWAQMAIQGPLAEEILQPLAVDRSIGTQVLPFRFCRCPGSPCARSAHRLYRRRRLRDLHRPRCRPRGLARHPCRRPPQGSAPGRSRGA